jgi:predicted transcriptional regulator
MKLTTLCERFDLKESCLKQHLKLLENTELVDKQNFGKKQIFYEVTERGFLILNIIRPLIKEPKNIQLRRFESIATVLLEAVQQ